MDWQRWHGKGDGERVKIGESDLNFTKTTNYQSI
jgi:hypothetical protein